ncbi:MAG: beta-galactosidase, partial [Armatimonadota bacterium]|nr:beta-galactosidase [Armatimonadota bacterium]
MKPTLTLAPIQLRGYGKVSGQFRKIDQPPGASILQITCESAAKAQIVHAKYLSDLGLLPGVTEITLPDGVTAPEVAGQGAIAALRAGAQVFILAARNQGALAQLVARQFKGAKPVSRPEVEVPMYLDRWDKFGFRFYYRPWEYPPSLPRPEYKTYDFAHEFEWAEKQERTGLVFWNDQNRVDTAEGLMNEVWWDWGQNAARARRLPVAINITAGGGATPVWLLNRYREQTQQRMPGYVGDFYAVARQDNGGHGSTSWNATEMKDVELSLLQSSVRRFSADPNVVSWLEPHGELIHGAHDILMEYGPVADASYRRYLQQKYKTPAALSQRWHGDANRIPSWDAVRVPELASFLGWGTQAIDLTGTWRIGYESGPGGKEYTADELRAYTEKLLPTEPVPAAWFTTEFDDSAWPTVVAPGHDRTMFLPKRPAVYRRKFEVSAEWKANHPRAWLYIWDLNKAWTGLVQPYLNGQKLGESKVKHPHPHWDVFEATAALKAGTNQLSLRLPQGFLAYRVYLSPEEPTQYPNLGEKKNAQWVDFIEWVQWSRIETCRRGVEMIRQVDPNRQITFMHPDEYSDGVKRLAQDYGGEFHNTGYMGAFYADYNPLLMQGAGLPFSIEPGGPPDSLPIYKKMMGLYYSEGVQSVDYFIHIGNVLWNDDIRQEFEATQPLVHLIGKYHAPQAEVAVLYATGVSGLTGYPWGNDPNVNLGSGYWQWNVAANLRDRYARDGLTESDFTRGNAAKYRVIIDSNTSIMDEALIRGIEQYVRDGGTFITFVQTGRHTPEQKDAWPISRLTGYRVTRINRYNPDGQVPAEEWHKLRAAPNQTIFRPDNWKVDIAANGLALQKVAPDCQDLLLWEDGSVAV